MTRVTLSGQETDAARLRSTRKKVLTASFIGNFVEWFDYAVYIYFSAAISHMFFPKESENALILTFAIFAVSFLIRPIGGFVWGHLGDRVGRKTALSWSILLMSAATFLIAFLPTWDMVGILAPLLLLLLRMVQGFSASGEYAGASAFLVEYAPADKRGRYAAVVPASTATGLLLGSLFATVFSAVLTTEQLDSWGWRIPFLLAAPLGLIGKYIRDRLEDSPAFQEIAQEDEAIKAPIGTMFLENWRELLRGFGAVLLNAVGFYVILTYMPTYLSNEVKLDETLSFIATTVALLTYIGFIFITGSLSDRFGRRKVLMAASICAIVLTVPAFMLLNTGNFYIILLVQVMLGFALTLNDGTLPSFLSELFPTKVRYSGFAVSFNLGNAIFGGTAAMVATWLIKATGNQIAPAYYLIGAAVISFIAVALSHETSKDELK